MRSTWFDGLQTKSEMNSLVIGEIESIMGDLSTSADVKVLEIARALDGLRRAWDAKKTSASTEAPKVNSQLYSTIDVSKVEDLIVFPLIPLGPLCRVCDCFKCKKLHNCTIKLPSVIVNCKDDCNGRIARNVCYYARKRGFVE